MWLVVSKGQRRWTKNDKRKRSGGEEDKNVSSPGTRSLLRPIKSFPRDRTVGESVQERENRSIEPARVSCDFSKSSRRAMTIEGVRRVLSSHFVFSSICILASSGWIVFLFFVFDTGSMDTYVDRERKHGRARVRTRQGLVGKRRRRVALVTPGSHEIVAGRWSMAGVSDGNPPPHEFLF